MNYKKIVALLACAFSFGTGLQAETFEEPNVSGKPADWGFYQGKTMLMYVDPDIQHPGALPPDMKVVRKPTQLKLWRGETAGTMLMLANGGKAKNLTVKVSPPRGKRGRWPAGTVQANFLLFTAGHEGIYADILESAPQIPVPAYSSRPIWLTVNVPHKAAPGVYSGEVVVTGDGVNQKIPYSIEVKKIMLPPPSKWKFHLDIWQNPFSIARWHDVELWSDEHLKLITEYYRPLAQMGQKAITVTLVDKPWGAQTYDPYGEMVTWTKKRDGSWTYDFTVFDKYVQAAMKAGITGQINCYSMIPWSNRFEYVDEASGTRKAINVEPGSEAYENHWRPFLHAFRQHLGKRRLLDRTTIAMDERPHHIMVKLLNFLKKEAPEIKIASAINYAKQDGSADLFDMSVAVEHDESIDPNYLKNRQKKGQITTFYVCCNPGKPNTFTHSPPVESAWLGIHAAAKDLSGFLRWAYNSWVADPFKTTAHPKRSWLPGDCFLVYPGFRSSIRFERLREGIIFYEKYQLIKQKLGNKPSGKAGEIMAKLDERLTHCMYHGVLEEGAAKQVNEVKALMEQLTDAL